MTAFTPATVESEFPDIDPTDPYRVVARTLAQCLAGGGSVLRHLQSGTGLQTGISVADDVVVGLRSAGFAIEPPTLFRPGADDMTFTAFGVSLSELGEDGDRIVILGHQNARRVAAALNRYWRTVVGLDRDDIRSSDGLWKTPPESLTHREAVFIAPAAHADPDWNWYCTIVPPPRPGPYDRLITNDAAEIVVPVTLWDAP